MTHPLEIVPILILQTEVAATTGIHVLSLTLAKVECVQELTQLYAQH